MKWNRFTIKPNKNAEEHDYLYIGRNRYRRCRDSGSPALTEEDKAQMFVDIMPEGPEDDGVAYLNFLSGGRCG